MSNITHTHQISTTPRVHLIRPFPQRNQRETRLSNNKSRKRFLYLSKDFSRHSGISTERTHRISMDKMYDEDAFGDKKKDQSTRNSSSVTIAIARLGEGEKQDRMSTNPSSTFSNSQSSQMHHKHSHLHARSPIVNKIKQQEIIDTYYAQEKQHPVKVRPQFTQLSRHDHLRSGGYKKYDIRGLIRY